MSKVWIITKRELSGFFDSLIAYVMIILFLGITGAFTWLFGTNVFMRGQASLDVFDYFTYLTLFFFIPAITMRMIAEENKSGTIELLITKAISDSQIVLGKFFACLILVAVSLAFTVSYYITLTLLGNVDDGAVFGSYLSLILMSASYVSIGLFASSLTQNQIVSFLLSISILALFHWIFGVIGREFTGPLSVLFSFLSMSTHVESLSRGVIDSRDIIYFFSIMVVGLSGTQIMLSKRNWK